MKQPICVTLGPVTDREQFILDNQAAFRYGALEEFGLRDDHTGPDGEIISRQTVESCLDDRENESFRILLDGVPAGGAIVKLGPHRRHNHLEILFVHPDHHGKGVGQAAWKLLEQQYPETQIWETCTPHFDTRNIHFYINKCGFAAVEFFCPAHPDPHPMEELPPEEGPDLMFRFVKQMK